MTFLSLYWATTSVDIIIWWPILLYHHKFDCLWLLLDPWKSTIPLLALCFSNRYLVFLAGNIFWDHVGVFLPIAQYDPPENVECL